MIWRKITILFILFFWFVNIPIFADQESKLCLPYKGEFVQDGLSAFWAQEYIGADLLREEIKNAGILHMEANLFDSLDSPDNKHGEQVMQLIAGPFESAIIPLKKAKQWNNFTDRHELDKLCLQAHQCPSYRNISMEQMIGSNLFSEIAQQGTTIVMAAGNESMMVSSRKRILARKGSILLVGNLAPSGGPSASSSFAPEIIISAPADSFIRSYDFAGNPTTFSGTSAAAPLVTGTLAAFTHISGHALNQAQSAKLLKKTSLPLPELPSVNYMGGMLNSYKIGMIAFKLKSLCGEDQSCYSKFFIIR